MAGAPYYASPLEVLKQWTLPQVIYHYIGKQEAQAADARQQFILTMAAIGATLSKDGQKIANNVLESLNGPKETVEDMMAAMSEAQLLVMFGRDRLTEMGYYGEETGTD